MIIERLTHLILSSLPARDLAAEAALSLEMKRRGEGEQGQAPLTQDAAVCGGELPRGLLQRAVASAAAFANGATGRRSTWFRSTLKAVMRVALTPLRSQSSPASLVLAGEDCERAHLFAGGEDRCRPCEETALLLGVLREAGEIPWSILVEEAANYFGEQKYLLASGWRVTVYIKRGAPNYIDSMISPDGKVWEFHDIPNEVRQWASRGRCAAQWPNAWQRAEPRPPIWYDTL